MKSATAVSNRTSGHVGGLPICKPEWSDDMRWLFDLNGFLILENVLSEDEVARYLEVARRVAARAGTSSVRPMIEADPVFPELMDHPITFPIALKLLGNSLQVYASTLVRNARTNAFVSKWHQDGPGYGVRFEDISYPTPLLQLRMSYFLTDCLEFGQGGLKIVPGSHKSRTALPEDLREMENVARPVFGKAGSVFIFHNGLWHAGTENETDNPRFTAHIQYTPVWVRPVNNHRYSDEFKSSLTPRRRLLLADNDNTRDIYHTGVYSYADDGSINSPG